MFDVIACNGYFHRSIMNIMKFSIMKYDQTSEKHLRVQVKLHFRVFVDCFNEERRAAIYLPKLFLTFTHFTFRPQQHALCKNLYCAAIYMIYYTGGFKEDINK